jgi:hypothetical protein
MSIVSKADVKLFLFPSGTSTGTDDTLLDKLIACAEADAVAQVGAQISTISTYTEVFDGDGLTGSVMLKTLPVTAINAVYDDIARAFTSDSLISAALYAFTSAGVLKLDPGWVFTLGVQNVKVVYSAGYSAIPEDFKKAIIYMVMADYMGVKTRINAVADDEIGGKIKALRQQAKDIIDRYRVI